MGVLRTADSRRASRDRHARAIGGARAALATSGRPCREGALARDDSNGTIGDLARELLDLHARACDAGVADPVKLAAWIVKFSCEDQDFFDLDPVRYAKALGERGLAAYRDAIAKHSDGAFAVRRARERLAVLDGDTQAIISLLGDDLTKAHQFIRIAEAMAELGRDDEVLAWALRGIAETDGWQLDKLYNLACDVHEHRNDKLEVLALRREQTRTQSILEHLHQPTTSRPTARRVGARTRRRPPSPPRPTAAD